MLQKKIKEVEKIEKEINKRKQKWIERNKELKTKYMEQIHGAAGD